MTILHAKVNPEHSSGGCLALYGVLHSASYD